MIFPWLLVMDSIEPVTKEELERVKQTKQRIPRGKHYNLPFKYKEDQ